MTIICQKLNAAKWCAWIEGRAGSVVMGYDPTVATRRLSQQRPGVLADRIIKDECRSRADRHVYRVAKESLTQCCNQFAPGDEPPSPETA